MERCRWCGASVSPKDVVCPTCGARLRRESSTCPRCRGEVRSGLAVCPHCGEDLLRRRFPWKLIGALVGAAVTVIVVYGVLQFVPLPLNLPFVASVPSPTATEAILPPTPTATETPRPPTATPTSTATPTEAVTTTLTPAATVTATITVSVTATVAPTALPVSTETPVATATETGGFRYAAPVLLAPADESELPAEGPFNFTEASVIELSWEPVGALGENQWYSVSLVLTDRDGQPQEKVNWRKESTFVVPSEYHGDLGSDREVHWSVTVVSGTPGAGESRAISPPSENWMFRWG
jgi:hypothetical protein